MEKQPAVVQQVEITRISLSFGNATIFLFTLALAAIPAALLLGIFWLFIGGFIAALVKGLHG